MRLFYEWLLKALSPPPYGTLDKARWRLIVQNQYQHREAEAGKEPRWEIHRRTAQPPGTATGTENVVPHRGSRCSPKYVQS